MLVTCHEPRVPTCALRPPQLRVPRPRVARHAEHVALEAVGQLAGAELGQAGVDQSEASTGSLDHFSTNHSSPGVGPGQLLRHEGHAQHPLHDVLHLQLLVGRDVCNK